MIKEISIFLLAYNEEENIKKCVESALSVAKKVAKKYEVIVVAYDGSSDNTIPVVESLIKKHRNLKIVNQSVKDKGYGAALRLGILNSKYDLIFYTDADNQFDIKQITKLLPFVDKSDIVSGYRFKRKDPFMRIVAARTYNLILRLLFGLKMRDVDSAFKIYKKKVFDKIKINYKTGIADAEILIKARKYNYNIEEVPVNHYSRQAGKEIFSKKGGMIRMKVVVDLLKDMASLFKEIHKSN